MLQYPQQQDLYPPYSPRLMTPDCRRKNDTVRSREGGNRNIGHDLHGEHGGKKDGTGWDYPVRTPPLPLNGSFLGDDDSTRQQHQASWSSHSLPLHATSMTPGNPDRAGHDTAVSARRHRSPSYPRRRLMITPNCYRTSSDQPQDRRSPLPLRTITPGDMITTTSRSNVLTQEGIGSPLTNGPERPVQGDETRFVQGRQPTSLQSVAYQENQKHSEKIVDGTKMPQKRRRNVNMSEQSSMSEKRLPGEALKPYTVTVAVLETKDNMFRDFF